MRHWKERFPRDFETASFVYLKHRLIGGRKVKPGDVMTADEQTKFGRHRLSRWWAAGYVGNAPGGAETTPQAAAPEAASAEPVVTNRGPAWRLITYPDGATKTVRGKKAVEAALTEWRESQLQGSIR